MFYPVSKKQKNIKGKMKEMMSHCGIDLHASEDYKSSRPTSLYGGSLTKARL